MNNRFLDSPVNTNSFIWVASYADGTFLPEFSYDSLTENSFYSIDKQKLIRFGLVGYGMNMYYEVFGGVFKIAGQMIEIFYKTNEKQYFLTGQQLMYNDIIQYKCAETSLSSNGQSSGSFINQYNFGYKQNIQIDDINFNYKAICSIPYRKPVFLNIRLVSDKELNGQICIRKNGLKLYEYDAPMEANVAYELNWEVVL